jgi:hypothetical protein
MLSTLKAGTFSALNVADLEDYTYKWLDSMISYSIFIEKSEIWTTPSDAQKTSSSQDRQTQSIEARRFLGLDLFVLRAIVQAA